MDTLLTLVQNMLVLLGFSFVFGFSLPKLELYPRYIADSVLGIGFGILGIINMAFSVEIAPGVINDIRGPVVMIAIIYGGMRGGSITAGMMMVYRYAVIGGAGALPGTIAILMNLLIVIVIKQIGGTRYANWYKQPDARGWAFLGLASMMGSVITSFLFLPYALFNIFVASFIPSAMLFYPITTIFLGASLQWEKYVLDLHKRLQMNEARFRTTFDESFQFIGLLTHDGIVIDSNKTSLDFIGATVADVVNKPYTETPWWRHSEEEKTRLHDAIKTSATGQLVRYRTQLMGKDDRILTVDFSIKPLFDEKTGAVMMLIPEARDITNAVIAESQRLELALEREQTAIIKRFVADSSHHIRTPITILMSSSYLFKNTLGKAITAYEQLVDLLKHSSADDTKPVLDVLQIQLHALKNRIPKFEKNISELNHLIDNLQELVKHEQIDDNMTIVRMDLVTMVDGEVSNFQSLAHEANITLQYSAPEKKPLYAEINAESLQLILRNLIENAIYYTPANGSVVIALSSPIEGNFTLIVSDTGIGISEEDQARIFDRFYRADNGMVARNKGTGLGLAIIKQIVELHGGHITVASVINQGTTFTVTLPLIWQKPTSPFNKPIG